MPLDQDIDDDWTDTGEHDESVLARMPLGDHLDELRHRLIMSLIGPMVAFVITMTFGWSLTYWITKPLLEVQQFLGLPPQTYGFNVTTGFGVYIKVSLVAAIIIAFPWICYQLWKFVESGLYAYERKGVILVVPFSAVMSMLGVAFLYYLLLPVCLAFLLFFTTTFPAVNVQERGQGGLLDMIMEVTISSYGVGSTGAEGGDGSQPNGQADGPATQPAATQSAATQPRMMAKLFEAPIVRHDPEKPGEGQMWVKVPEHELRMHLDGQIYRFLPFQSKSMMSAMIDIDKYLRFVTWLALGVVLAFQLPVVMLILGWSGLVSPHWFAHYRKYCVFGCFAVGAVFTPADPVSMMVLALPLWGLFEFGLLLMRIAYRAPEPMD
jgi:Tat protein translocase TatC